MQCCGEVVSSKCLHLMEDKLRQAVSSGIFEGQTLSSEKEGAEKEQGKGMKGSKGKNKKIKACD